MVCLNKAVGLEPAQPPCCWAQGPSRRLCKNYGADFLVAVMMGMMMAMMKMMIMMVMKVMVMMVRGRVMMKMVRVMTMMI